MNKFLTALVAGLLVAGAALADIAPPPPPKGKKYVGVSNEVVLGKDVSGYVFVTQVSTFPARGQTFAKAELTATKAVAMPAAARRTFVELLAVPQDAAKEFKTDAELFDALKADKVKGVHRLAFGDSATVDDAVKEKTVKWTHTITAINPKDGIKEEVKGEGYEPPAKKGGAPDKEEEDDAPVTRAPRGGVWVAGLAAFAGVLLGGLWVAGRTRRKV